VGTKSTIVSWFIVVGALVTLPAVGHAQEAVVSGTVTDSTGAVLPGVAVTAVHEASGNTFETVTDGRGNFRLQVRVGAFSLGAQLAGFTTITRTGLVLLVGQTAKVDLQLAPSQLAETVSVTGEAPLVDTTTSSLGSNIDPRQVADLPVLGRSWMDLTLLAVGARENGVTADAPGLNIGSGGFQINLDGQQVTQVYSFANGQHRVSRDGIAEFEYVTGRFSATQGRSSGVVVNAITKSGTNIPSGSVSGFFRNDRFNAADHIAGYVLPYSNQAVSTTFGGPIRKDRVHFFAYYEYEREPQTYTYQSPWPSFNIDQTVTREEHKPGVRLDYQHSSSTRLSARAGVRHAVVPFEDGTAGGAVRHPSAGQARPVDTTSVLGTLTKVLSNRAVNEIRGGFFGFESSLTSPIVWKGHPAAARLGVTSGTPNIRLLGYTIGQDGTNAPTNSGQDYTSIKDDFTYSLTKGGRHDLQMGGEYGYMKMWLGNCRQCMGILDARNGPPPANLEALFPVWDNPDTWNLTPLSSITRMYTLGFTDEMFTYVPRHVIAGWLQDNWALTSRLTVNLGMRYDLETGVFAESTELLPWLKGNRPHYTNNNAPRFGSAYPLHPPPVARGGAGKYFGEVSDQIAHGSPAWTRTFTLDVLNDGRPDFASNPFNGPIPSVADIKGKMCDVNPSAAGCVRQSIQDNLASDNLQVPYSYQTSIGLQRQVGNTVGIEADYVFNVHRHELFSRNSNLTYNPATGANYSSTVIPTRLNTNWGNISQFYSDGRASYQALQAGLTKRFSQRWQSSATYLLSGTWDEIPAPDVGFPLAVDMGAERALATGDQRHRVVFNGILEAGYGFQLSGIYFFGSGQRYSTIYGGDLRRQGLNPTNRLRPDNTLVPRNNFVGDPIHRVDLRIQRRFPLGGRAGIDGMLEVFNLFDRANYGTWITDEASSSYGKPSTNTGIAYAPRMLQLGLRVEF